MDAELTTAIEAWLAAVTTNVLAPQVNDEWAKRGIVYKRLSIDYGKMYAKIISSGYHAGRSSWAFVALADGMSKAMGSYKRGDIFKAASWAAPAKYARGNVFDTSHGPTCNVHRWTGPEYLK